MSISKRTRLLSESPELIFDDREVDNYSCLGEHENINIKLPSICFEKPSEICYICQGNGWQYLNFGHLSYLPDSLSCFGQIIDK